MLSRPDNSTAAPSANGKGTSSLATVERQTTHATRPSLSLRLKYACPLGASVHFEISPVTRTRLGKAVSSAPLTARHNSPTVIAGLSKRVVRTTLRCGARKRRRRLRCRRLRGRRRLQRHLRAAWPRGRRGLPRRQRVDVVDRADELGAFAHNGPHRRAIGEGRRAVQKIFTFAALARKR